MPDLQRPYLANPAQNLGLVSSQQRPHDFLQFFCTYALYMVYLQRPYLAIPGHNLIVSVSSQQRPQDFLQFCCTHSRLELSVQWPCSANDGHASVSVSRHSSLKTNPIKAQVKKRATWQMRKYLRYFCQLGSYSWSILASIVTILVN